MGEKRSTFRIFVGKTEGKRPLGRQRIILQEVLGRTNRILSFDMTRTAEIKIKLGVDTTDTQTARRSHKPHFIVSK
jgi:hypothetical protein